MTREYAETLGVGDTVDYHGERRQINSVKLGLIDGPHFRLSGVDGLTSWRLCEAYFPRARYGDGYSEGSGSSEEHSDSGGY
jgi:hypothetical protein